MFMERPQSGIQASSWGRSQIAKPPWVDLVLHQSLGKGSVLCEIPFTNIFSEL